MLTKIEFREAPKVRRCRARASSLGIFVRSFVSFPLVFFPFYLLVAFIFLVFSVSSRFVLPFSFSVSPFCLACPNGSERKLQPPSNVSPKTPKTPRRFAEFSFHFFSWFSVVTSGSPLRSFCRGKLETPSARPKTSAVAPIAVRSISPFK